jgi:hypothetical protein
MGKLTRVFQNLFGLNAGSQDCGEFGSFAAGSPEYVPNPTQNVGQLQTQDGSSVAAFLVGFAAAIEANDNPALEDMNSLFVIAFYQLCYLMQQGIAEYDGTTIYFMGSVVAVSGIQYVCINDNSGAGISNEPVTDSTYWDLAVPPAGNSILNSGFDWWQRGLSSVTIENSFSTQAFTYSADRWAASNLMGSGGSPVLTMSQASGTLSGSVYALKAQVTVAPSGTGSFAIYQILDRISSQKYANKNAVFSIQMKALGNLTKVQVGFVYSTSDYGTPVSPNIAQNLNALGSPVTVTLSITEFTTCSIPATSVGDVLGTTGIIGIVITAAGNSNAGGIYAIDDGFIMEQAQMNVGGVLLPWQRAYSDAEVELDAICRFYETSLVINGGSGSVCTSGGWEGDVTSSHVYNSPVCLYRSTKLLEPASQKLTLTAVGDNLNFGTASVNTYDQQGFSATATASATGVGEYYFSFTCDSEIY